MSAVLSGGSVATIYSDNEYPSYDLDFVTPEAIKGVAEVMKKPGFVRKSRRHFEHPDSAFLVDTSGSTCDRTRARSRSGEVACAVRTDQLNEEFVYWIPASAGMTGQI